MTDQENKNLDFSYLDKNEKTLLFLALTEKGIVHVNTWSRDCDGVEGYHTHSYDSVQDYIASKIGFVESLEGPGRWEIVPEELKLTEDECGSFGQGWGIN